VEGGCAPKTLAPIDLRLGGSISAFMPNVARTWQMFARHSELVPAKRFDRINKQCFLKSAAILRT
jgi:hypothetical protein